METTETPSIAEALAGMVSAQRELISVWQQSLVDMNRREEELRELIADLDHDKAPRRSVEALHSRIDEMSSMFDSGPSRSLRTPPPSL